MPQITASFAHNEQLIPLDVSFELTLDDLRAYIAAETDEDTAKLIIQHNGKTFDENESLNTLEQLGFHDGDVILVTPKTYLERQTRTQELQHSTQGREAQLETMRHYLLSNPQALASFSAMDGRISSAVNDSGSFRSLMEPLLAQRMGQFGLQPEGSLPGGVSLEEWERLNRTRDDPVSQQRIRDLNDIQNSFELAMEETPEMFGSVVMLYVSLEVNGVPVKAFIDSGAQATIISPGLAKKCGLDRLIDTRFKGIAMGVGKSEILGRILSAQLKIESAHVPVSFTVVDAGVDMLLGLDMLRRHQASIDLKDNLLRIAGVETPFLPESEIPKSAFESAIQGQQLGSTSLGPTPSMATYGSARSAAAEAALRRTQTVAASQPSAITQSLQPTTSSLSEHAIANLISLGFTRQEAIRALEMSGGNPEVAASLLFQ